jgi:hypothetical protein
LGTDDAVAIPRIHHAEGDGGFPGNVPFRLKSPLAAGTDPDRHISLTLSGGSVPEAFFGPWDRPMPRHNQDENFSHGRLLTSRRPSAAHVDRRSLETSNAVSRQVQSSADALRPTIGLRSVALFGDSSRRLERAARNIAVIAVGTCPAAAKWKELGVINIGELLTKWPEREQRRQPTSVHSDHRCFE